MVVKITCLVSSIARACVISCAFINSMRLVGIGGPIFAGRSVWGARRAHGGVLLARPCAFIDAATRAPSTRPCVADLRSRVCAVGAAQSCSIGAATGMRIGGHACAIGVAVRLRMARPCVCRRRGY